MENENRKRRRERLYRLVALAEHPDFDMNPNIRAEWEQLKNEMNPSRDETIDAQMVEVLQEGKVIFTGSGAEVRTECRITKEVLYKKLNYGTPDRKKRYYRVKE
ncbi:hypothetical protein MXF21_11415 [Enterococcus casseliflavus]|uniref:hypothetical protein n=1 Tax=Enterococcus casseliflavus TaxID=37734 RepID=UPI002DBE3EB1|nr:hypothetical protein [Enterococcus casseliflavus]MEB6086723.1 hypothetical protein [Enterococcus casseliflavus]